MVRAGIGALAAALSLTLACGDDDGTRADGGPGDGDGGAGGIDGSDGVSALELSWRLMPPIDGEPVGALSLVITDARFVLEDLRAIGDAEVLERSSFDVDFGEDREPVLRFAPAAPGLYSSFAAGFDRYTVRGTVDVDGQTREFEVRDEPPSWVSFSVPLEGVEVLPERTERVRLRIDFGAVLEQVDWSRVEIEDGVLELDRDSEEIFDVRDALESAFAVD